jgi:hypothetical protein
MFNLKPPLVDGFRCFRSTKRIGADPVPNDVRNTKRNQTPDCHRTLQPSDEHFPDNRRYRIGQILEVFRRCPGCRNHRQPLRRPDLESPAKHHLSGRGVPTDEIRRDPPPRQQSRYRHCDRRSGRNCIAITVPASRKSITPDRPARTIATNVPIRARPNYFRATGAVTPAV